MDILEFIFGDFWHFCGVMALVLVAGLIVCEWIDLLTRDRRR